LSLLAFLTMTGSGVDLVVFGPQTYVRDTGEPVSITSPFNIANISGAYTLVVANNGVTSAVISVNGKTVLSPSDFTGKNTAAAVLRRPVVLVAGVNQVVVELRSKPGTSLTVEIIGANVDTTPPTITATANPQPNANGWNQTDVTVTFACLDNVAIQSCPAPAVVSTEGANQNVQGTATDTSGNTAMASVSLNIDKTPPLVTASATPPANVNGWNKEPVVVRFAANDALSGVLPGSLSAPVTLSTDGLNQSATGHAADLAGNVSSMTLSGINIDQVNPRITVALSPPPNANGFLRHRSRRISLAATRDPASRRVRRIR